MLAISDEAGRFNVKRRLKGCWDFLILGKFKSWLVAVWFLIWIVPKGINKFYLAGWKGVWHHTQVDYLFIFQHFTDFGIEYHLYLWNNSSIIYWVGMILVGVVLFLFVFGLLTYSRQPVWSEFRR